MSISRKQFLNQLGIASTSLLLLNSCNFSTRKATTDSLNVKIGTPKPTENVFSYIKREKGQFDLTYYRQIIGAANEFKEGDATLGLSADTTESRLHARELLANTTIEDLVNSPVYEDELSSLIQDSTNTDTYNSLKQWTLGQLKTYLLSEKETAIKNILPGLTSDIIACVVKLMSNEELIQIGQKVFSPIPNTQIGSKGYLSARIQPNSPTDNPEDIQWQVFDAWSYSVGDLVLGTNPVSSDPESVAKIESTLFDILKAFKLENTLPNCVLSHIDIQAEVEKQAPGSTGIWFQSLAGTVAANKTFDVTIDKMLEYAHLRNGQYGIYAETGQGADFTNGHGEGFDMVIHEARKYGFVRALKQKMSKGKTENEIPWVHLNDVAGFIGPEVFKTKEQLVRCCLEDTVMGKLHGLPIGLDICSTLHMDISLDDLDWCISEIMPANPAYLMALPTKNDPMLSYLTTAFHNHLEVREKFNYKINDAMWAFFKEIEIIGEDNKPTDHFGDPIWVYYKYCLAKGDEISKEAIYKEGLAAIKRIEDRGVPIAKGFGDNYWDLEPRLASQVNALYEDAKKSLWTEFDDSIVKSIPAALAIATTSKDRKDYVYHPESGERLSRKASLALLRTKNSWLSKPDVQIIISDGLNVRSLTDESHLLPYIEKLKVQLAENNYSIANESIIIKHGRVRAGYACGEALFGDANSTSPHAIIHIIGERPGSGHHNFSAYITAANASEWNKSGLVDHDITKVVSGISDTALKPEIAATQTAKLLNSLFKREAIS